MATPNGWKFNPLALVASVGAAAGKTLGQAIAHWFTALHAAVPSQASLTTTTLDFATLSGKPGDADRKVLFPSLQQYLISVFPELKGLGWAEMHQALMLASMADASFTAVQYEQSTTDRDGKAVVRKRLRVSLPGNGGSNQPLAAEELAGFGL